jgi:UDPglucose 6-dehydrogenase
MKIAIIGTGFVGITTCAVYASFNHQVWGLDIDEKKIASLKQGEVPFYEPKLTEMILSGIENGNLHFSTSYQRVVSNAEIIILSVGTPSKPDGSINLSYIKAAAQAIAPFLHHQAIVAIKSTVLPGTLAMIKKIIQKQNSKTIHYVSLPEFLKEGTAVDDTLFPDRVVIGAHSDFAYQKLHDLHAPMKAPVLRVLPESAQLAKYASNDYLALRIIYANVLAEICNYSGADIDEVLTIIGHEKRIGSHYWYPGLGYGGSCFPKDVQALAHYLRDFIPQEQNLFTFMDTLNSRRPAQVLRAIKNQVGSFRNQTVTILGLSFKPNTDDQRESPALALIPLLLSEGATIISYDPMVKTIADKSIASSAKYQQVATIETAVAQADIIMALVEWPQIVGFDFATTKLDKPQFFFDVRNQFDQHKLLEAGYHYLSIGRRKQTRPSCGIK